MHKIFYRFIFIILGLIYSEIMDAQLNYKEGIIITNEGDSIKGLVNDGGFDKNYRYCLFKENSRSKATKYYPHELKAYKINEEKYYVSKEVEVNNINRYTFVEVLLDGNISLYYYPAMKDLSYFLEKNDKLFCLKNLKIDIYPSRYVYGPVIIIETKEYIDTLRTIFHDSKAVKSYIGQVQYNHESLIAIIRKYLIDTDTNDVKIFYQKNMRLSKSSVGLIAGTQVSQMKFTENKTTSNVVRSYPVGLIYSHPLPIFNEKLCFQAELIYYKLSSYEGAYNIINTDSMTHISYKSNYNVVSIPFMLKYYFFKKKLSPSVGIGKESGFIINSDFNYSSITYYHDKTISDLKRDDYLLYNFQKGWFADIGLDYKISSRFTIFTNIRLQSNQNLIIPYKNFNHYTFNSAYKIDTKYDKTYEYLFKNYFVGLYFGIKFR